MHAVTRENIETFEIKNRDDALLVAQFVNRELRIISNLFQEAIARCEVNRLLERIMQ